MKKLILLSLLICAALSAAELRIVRQPANGQCKLNEESEFKIVYSGASAKSVSVAFLGNGVTEKVTLPLEKANGEITLKRTMNVPGNLICTAEMAGAKKAVAGTLFAPEKIFAVSPAPSDFDAFWQAELNKLDAVKPIAKQIIPPNQPKGVTVYDVTIPCTGNAPVKATLGIPDGNRKWPIEVTFHGAGVMGSRMLWKAQRLQRILFDINAHGIDNLKDEAYYAEQRRRFKAYP